jgi:hypothetical protein
MKGLSSLWITRGIAFLARMNPTTGHWLKLKISDHDALREGTFAIQSLCGTAASDLIWHELAG